MAYAVVASLRQTIDGLVNDDSGHISIAENWSADILELVYKELRSFKRVLKKFNRSSSVSKSSSRSRSINRERVNALDGQIRDALCELEDILDFHVLDQIHSQTPAGYDEMINHHFTLDLEQLTQQFISLERTLINMKAEYIHELCLEEEEEEEEDDDLDVEAEQFMNAVPDHHFGGYDDDDESDDSDDIVGLSDMFISVKDQITQRYLRVTAIHGMAGIGKTTLAKKLFRDPQIAALFQRCAFITIGQNYRLEAVLLDILKKMNPEKVPLTESDVKQRSVAFLKRMVYQSLKARSCFIVLDDVWHITLWNELESLFPNNDSHVLLTSRLKKVADLASALNNHIPFLNKKESWHLLRKKVFGDQESSCPPQLVKAGEKIAKNCEGLPLTIVKVANILSRADTTPEFWNEVAGHKQHPVYVEAYEQMYEVLYLSYDYLPQHLKPFFLYIGVFPQNYQIPRYKLINLWCAEGLYAINPSYIDMHLLKLYRRNLVILPQKRYYDMTKTISFHSVFWYISNKEARKNKFFYCLNTLADSLEEDMNSQRRLCIQNNVLFGIIDVHNSISSISTVRSLLCTGAYHPYPVPICLGMRLLKVLDALTIRLYEFPMEVLNRVNLAYLALTLDVKLPSSISRLWNLKYLIVRQHVRIVKSPSYLPMEIWNMTKLVHLQVSGSDLPNPCQGFDDDHILPNLFRLSDVSARSCTKAVFKGIPKVNKLGVRVELAPEDDEPLCFFDDISHLHELETLKCIMATPKIMSGVVAPPAPLSIFSSSLRKLTLSGMGYPWEEMTKISSLPKLRILKLQCYAFRGPKWVVVDKEFLKLKSLVIEDTDLVKWTSLQDYYSLAKLGRLTIKHCYNLLEIPSTLFGESLKAIEIVDCNPLAHNWAEQLKKHQWEQFRRGILLDCNISSSSHWAMGTSCDDYDDRK